METPQERRQRETFERCTTDAQRATVTRLHEQGVTAYAETRQGRTVVAECRRYFETCDAEKIGAGLYAFSTGGAGGFNEIAHYDLGGFRHVYHHPAVYLNLVERARRGHDPREFHSQYVYTDGMTAGEVAVAIFALAEAHEDAVTADYRLRRDAEALAEAQRLAESLGMKLVEA